jgi:glycosyltransferase involved in cell wall biosynthesis
MTQNSTPATEPSVALVHEWLAGWGGSESVLASLCSIFPEAPVHTLVYRPDARIRATFERRQVIPTLLDRVPGAGNHYRWWVPLMPAIWNRTRAPATDLVISSSHAFSKGVDTRSVTHICYCHTPPRYIWDLRHEYVGGWARHLSAPLIAYLRRKDLQAAERVDHFVANSGFVAERIRRLYGREARVVYPPVDVDRFVPEERARRHFLAGGRLVRYKRVDRAVAAANAGGLPLIVFGEGPELPRLRAMAGPTVQFAGACDDEKLLELMRGAIALAFPGVEDFGILPVEAQAAGTPVIALAEGGARETIAHGETGVLYEEDSAEALLDAMVEASDRLWSVDACRRNAERFARPRFEAEFHALLTEFGAPRAQQSSD